MGNLSLHRVMVRIRAGSLSLRLLLVRIAVWNLALQFVKDTHLWGIQPLACSGVHKGGQLYGLLFPQYSAQFVLIIPLLLFVMSICDELL